jgi:lipoprotein LprG
MTLSTGDAMRGRVTMTRLTGAVTAVALVPALLAGCSGSAGDEGSDEPLAEARQTLEETSGVDLTVATDQVPQGADGFLRIEGTATTAPAFTGTVRVHVNDLTEDIPRVAVDGAVHARLPFTDVFAEIDPSSYGSPDPAELMDPEHGIAGWLAATEDVQESGDEVTGRVPGRVVAQLFESARPKGRFEASYRIDDGRLQRAALTGPFHGRQPTTYTVDISRYDVNKDITRP